MCVRIFWKIKRVQLLPNWVCKERPLKQRYIVFVRGDFPQIISWPWIYDMSCYWRIKRDLQGWYSLVFVLADNNIGPDCLEGPEAQDPNYCSQPTWLHVLCMEVLTVHRTELRLFGAKAFPLLILLISRICILITFYNLTTSFGKELFEKRENWNVILKKLVENPQP